MQADFFRTQVMGGASLECDSYEFSFEVQMDNLLLAIVRAESEGFLATHEALIEALRVLIEERQQVLQ